MPSTPYPWQREPQITLRYLVEGVILGVAYGLLLRGYVFLIRLPIAANLPWLTSTGAVMTVAFLLGGPFVIGLLSVRRAQPIGPFAVLQWIMIPWVSTVLMLGVTALLAWEGRICLLMALPIALVASSLGGIASGLLSRYRRPLSTPSAVSFALLPFLLAPAESLHTAPTQLRTVHSQILIHAPASTVWHNIERVPAISSAELRPTWTHRIGFPRPIEATLSYEGVGGVRDASFEHGLRFFETVTAWQPDHRLAFHIQADTAHIPPTTLDEHVTIGGRYFDVLDGEYRLESRADGSILLHLTSHQRLSTDFNDYAGLWSDAIMHTLQTSILQVVQHRCEAQPAATLAQDHVPSP